jgi:hypothetical protein
MSYSKIYHSYTRLPIFSTLALLWVNYELYRVTRGTHPWLTPRLEQAGLNPPRKNTTDPAANEHFAKMIAEAKKKRFEIEEREFGVDEARKRAQQREEQETQERAKIRKQFGISIEKVERSDKAQRKPIEWPKSEGPDWTFINGVPVPSFELLTRPFRPRD